MNTENKQLTEYAAKLNKLQAKIKSNGVVLLKTGRLVLELAIEAGTILCQVKQLLPHGEWQKWLAENVNGISDRTAEKYMKLARKTNHGSELTDDWKTLREAYLATGIIKQPTPKTPTSQEAESPSPAEEPPAPDNSADEQNLNDARLIIVERVRGDIETAGVNWNVATWAIKNDRPASDNTTNQLALTLSNLKKFILFRQFTAIERDVETEEKIKAVFNELLNAIIKGSHPSQPNVAEFAIELNPQPVEAVEQMAA
jgi:hypothetical protein